MKRSKNILLVSKPYSISQFHSKRHNHLARHRYILFALPFYYKQTETILGKVLGNTIQSTDRFLANSFDYILQSIRIRP